MAGCLLAALFSFAQTPQQIESDLLKSFKKIDPYKGSDDNTYSNDIFLKKLYNYTTHNPETIAYPFNSLKKGHLEINTSDDSVLRIYSWDTWTGGTMHFFDSIFQYRVDNKTYSVIDTATEGDVEPLYDKLYMFKRPEKTYYLTTYDGVGSTSDRFSGITIFAIINGKLDTHVKLIKTASGLHSSISYEYNFFSVLNWKVQPAISFDTKTQTIRIPVVGDKGEMTHNYIIYKFTGQYFERIKN